MRKIKLIPPWTLLQISVECPSRTTKSSGSGPAEEWDGGRAAGGAGVGVAVVSGVQLLWRVAAAVAAAVTVVIELL